MKTRNRGNVGMTMKANPPGGFKEARPGWISVPGSKLSMRLALVLAIVLIAASCSSNRPSPMRPQSTDKTIRSASAPLTGDMPVIQTATVADPGVTDIEVYEGSGVFINEEAAQPRPQVVSEDGEIVLNFEGESIQSVVHTILGEVLQETFVIGPGVSGEVTFSTSRPVR